MNSLVKNIRLLMTAHGDNNNRLAIKTGVSAGVFTRFFQGKSLTLGTVLKICEVYNVSLDWLVYDKAADIEKELVKVVERQAKEIEQYRRSLDVFRKQLLEQIAVNKAVNK